MGRFDKLPIAETKETLFQSSTEITVKLCPIHGENCETHDKTLYFFSETQYGVFKVYVSQVLLDYWKLVLHFSMDSFRRLLCLKIPLSCDLYGLILLQVDESLGLGSKHFLHEEEQASKGFRCKPRTTITQKPATFNGIHIKSTAPNQITILQTHKILSLESTTHQKSVSIKRALAPYIEVIVHPNLCAEIESLLHSTIVLTTSSHIIRFTEVNYLFTKLGHVT